MKKDLIEGNLERVKEILENIHDDDAIIMVASTNEDGNPVLDTLEGKPCLPKNTVCMLLSAALGSIRGGSAPDGEVTVGYILEPIMPTTKEVQ